MRLFVHAEGRKASFPPVVEKRAAMSSELVGVFNHMAVAAVRAFSAN
jgi:hypothetical protein